MDIGTGGLNKRKKTGENIRKSQEVNKFTYEDEDEDGDGKGTTKRLSSYGRNVFNNEDS